MLKVGQNVLGDSLGKGKRTQMKQTKGSVDSSLLRAVVEFVSKLNMHLHKYINTQIQTENT